ncbi:crossover junction endonuclease MUS81 [Takifugu flavidus]|uniref:Crossover junction endonuclease MUS81 n=1 Tax=Takifugu flavidus TaxID=433684 RepID=A0A5C6NDI8_9TELE|nr:crossover junction endonuclease MUS81 [Takifugu flavidus]TWW63577.1 Crossover junction endonuclease MUS81 [Takifugu flavidus]
MQASEPARLGRKRTLPSCPNPLFLKWLTELRDQAKEKGQKTQYTYQKAIQSLNKYPLPLRSAKEAKILQNFGDGICKILDEKLQRYYRDNGPDAPIHNLPKGAPPPNSQDNNLDPSAKKNVNGDQDKNGRGGRKKKREYVPQKRSGGYAVLLALFRESQNPGSKGFMFKMELQAEAQQFCDKSFTVPDLGSKYTAWSSVSTLIQKNLVIKTHNPARYSLTEDGLAVAERLDSEHVKKSSTEVDRARNKGENEDDGAEVIDLTGSEDGPDEAHASSEAGNLPDRGKNSQGTSGKPSAGCLLPGTYEIILCVDVIETTGGSHHRKQELVKELQGNGVLFDVRKLNVGDFLWVAREKVSPVPGQLQVPVGRELVLDYIIERKRIDDLCSSIIDGRFREQKFRLKRCGLRKPIYLVELHGNAASHQSLPENTLQQAIVSTQVVDGFFVKRVQDVRESAAYLAIMTRQLTKLYQNRTLVCRSRELEGDQVGQEDRAGIPSCSLISFAEFNHGAVKNKCQTVKEVFARQLMQISGLSGDKAAAILEHYNTPQSLVTAYDHCATDAEKEKLLSCIRYGRLKRNLGPALSRTLYQLYCTPGALS